MKDKLTGHPRGFGFVSFEDEDCIDLVLSKNHELFGKKVEVKKAEPKKQKVDNVKQVFNQSSFVYPVQYYYGNSYSPQFVPQYNDYEHENQYYYNYQSGYSPYSPPFSPQQPYEIENRFEKGNIQFKEKTIETLEPMSPMSPSRIVGSHRYREKQQHTVIENINQYIESSSLFLDTPQNNIINNKETPVNDRHSWSGFKSHNIELLEHNQLEDTFHRHSWSGW